MQCWCVRIAASPSSASTHGDEGDKLALLYRPVGTST